MSCETVQTRILGAIEKELVGAGIDPVQKTAYANTGHIYGMVGLQTLIDVDYGFHDTYCTIKLSGLAVGKDVNFVQVKYADGNRLDELIRSVRVAARAKSRVMVQIRTAKRDAKKVSS